MGISDGTSQGLPAGTRLHEFEIVRIVGVGGFSIVYLALDHQLHRHVAVKEYIPGTLAARGAEHHVTVASERDRETFRLGLGSFVNEARLLASFDHPSLLKVYRFWKQNGTAYMAMPYYSAPTLRAALQARTEPPDEGWLKRLLEPLLDALQTLHADRCYHRDISPDNILMLGSPPKPLLLDFGAARRVIGNASQALTAILKPGFAPIEQYVESSASARQGAWTDIYALCAVLYTAISGRIPIASVARLMHDELEPISQLARGRYSTAFLQAIDHGLTVRPEGRPQDVAALRAELFGDRPERVLPPVPGERVDVDGEAPAPPLVPVPVPVPGPVEMPAESAGATAPGGPASAPAAMMEATGPTPATAPASMAGVAPARADAGAPASATDSVSAAGPASRSAPASAESASSAPASASAAASGSTSATVPPAAVARHGTRLLPWLVLAVVVAGAGAGWIWRQKAPAPAAGATSADGTGATAASPVASVSPAAPASAPSPERPPFTVAGALDDIVRRADPAVSVVAIADKDSVRIGRDDIRLRVKSSRAGHLYVLFSGTGEQEIRLLYPNQRDTDPRIDANTEVTLPTPSSKLRMTASGPPGVDHIVAIVSPAPRNFDGVGLRSESATSLELPKFDLGQSARLWREGASAESPYAGRAECAASQPCPGGYGAALLRITELAPGN